jgi:ferredoxin-type protein NapG
MINNFKEINNMDRKQFIKSAGLTVSSIIGSSAAFSLVGKLLKAQPEARKMAFNPDVIRPPGALNEKDFLSACIRCQRCEEACMPEAIKLAGDNDSTYSGTPFILPDETACTLCLECTKVCPTGALKFIEKKEDVKIGLAKVDERTCVSHNGSGFCGACFTACPLHGKALKLNYKNAPTVFEDHCVGCGLCEEACILKETKAIRVFSNRKLS